METTTAELTTGVFTESTCLYTSVDRAPNSSEVIRQISELGTGAYVYMAVPVIMFTLLAIIYVEESVFLMKTTEYWERTQHKLWILSAFPVIGGLCVIGLFFPRSTPTIQILTSFYNALCMKKYADLILHYYGGKKKMAEITNEEEIIPNPFPCIMWCCFPKIPMDVRNIRIMQYLIYPVTIFQPIVYFILTILWAEGIQTTSLAPLVLVLQLSIPLASFVAVYGFVIMNKASMEPLRMYRLRAKFIAVQLILATNTVQMILLVCLDRFGSLVPCTFPYQSPNPGYILHLYIFPMELFLLSIMARYGFRFSEKGLHPIPAVREGDDYKVDCGELGKGVAIEGIEIDSDYKSQSDGRTNSYTSTQELPAVNFATKHPTGTLTGAVSHIEPGSPVSLTSYRYTNDDRLTCNGNTSTM